MELEETVHPTGEDEVKKKKKEEDKKPDSAKEMWQSYCCGREKTISRSMLKYIIQCVFSLLVLLFSFYMCTQATDSANREVWISTISCIVGLHVPAPHPEAL